MGRITGQPKFKQYNDAFAKLSMVIAVTRRFNKAEDGQDTDFIPVVLTGKLAWTAFRLLDRGTTVLIWGRIQVRSYTVGVDRKWVSEVLAENFQLLQKESNPQHITVSRQTKKQALAEQSLQYFLEETD